MKAEPKKILSVKAWLCEKVPEKEFDKCSEPNMDWTEICRKDGYVYLIRDNHLMEKKDEPGREN